MKKKLILLAEIARKFNEKHIRWAVGASLMLYLRGVADHFNDLDLFVEEDDLESARAVLMDMGQLHASPPNPDFCTKHFLEFMVEGCGVDLLAGFAVKSDGVIHSFPMEDRHDCVQVLGQSVPLQSLGRWRECYAAMKRPEKLRMVEAALEKESGAVSGPFELRCIWEHNGGDSLIYIENLPGAFSRGPSLAAAADKLKNEARSYLRWLGCNLPERFDVRIVQEQKSTLEIRDADSDVLFDAERRSLTEEEFLRLKALALKSAEAFQRLYDSVPEKEESVLAPRRTFYGAVPRTAREMYQHTKNVNSYYFGEIGVEADNEGGIAECRARGFAALEQQPGYLENPVFEGSYGEKWSLRKLLRRFIWHDRIHARAMYRMAERSFGKNRIPDIFRFKA